MSATAPRAAVPRVAPGERGATRIADRVIAKIAAQAAQEALRGQQTFTLVPDERFPRAHVTVRPPAGVPGGPRGRASIRLLVDLGYPADLGGVCAAVRHRVAERVGELVDVDVREVSVEVERLYSAAMAADRGRVR